MHGKHAVVGPTPTDGSTASEALSLPAMRLNTLEDFLAEAMSACQDVSADDPDGDISALLLTDDDEPDLLVMTVGRGDTPEPTAVDAFFAGRHDYAGMATMVSWSTDDQTPFGPSWMLVAVQRGRTAAFLVGRIDQRQWYQLMPEGAPWFAASTAGSLRKVLDGEPMSPIKKASEGDARLFGSTAHDPAPPEDEYGRI